MRRFALVFSINNTASLLIQVILQMVQQSTAATVTQQFRIFGGSLTALGVAFVLLNIGKHLFSYYLESRTTITHHHNTT